jgi:hypothetical protein
MKVETIAPGKYSAGFFRNNLTSFEKTLQNHGRQSIIRLLNLGHCFVPGCKNSIPSTSELDHLIPISRGGENVIENTFPLCKVHNSSKGKKDLIEWWMASGYPVEAFTKDAITHYARLSYAHLNKSGTLDDPAPKYLLDFVDALASKLRSESHRLAFFAIGENQN